MQREIQESAYRAQMAVDSGKTIVVGMNRFVEDVGTSSEAVSHSTNDDNTSPGRLFEIDAQIERQQIECVRAVRAGRSASAWETALAAVLRAANEGGNLVPPIITAVEAHATVGEIADTLRDVFGVYEESATL